MEADLGDLADRQTPLLLCVCQWEWLLQSACGWGVGGWASPEVGCEALGAGGGLCCPPGSHSDSWAMP